MQLKEVKKATFDIADIETDDLSQMGRITYTVTIIGGIDEATQEDEYVFEVHFRPTIDWLSSLREVPQDFIAAHIENKLRDHFEKKDVAIQEVEVNWCL